MSSKLSTGKFALRKSSRNSLGSKLVNVNSAGSDSRLQVLQESVHRQDVGSVLPRRLDHQLRVEHGLLAYILPRVCQFLVHAPANCTKGERTG
ncbi:hypothetical protein EYF80_025274 [Liparis tanakae]|uniref:Uncharacterized protein n=1 Tax=Liparis tanakae TaxID=230148 RepID=A0A4Z2HFN1_9TELE|nr:hypothetical protein EYF80_025274 [Liparis tanakae]